MPDQATDDTATEPVAKPWYLSRTILALIAGILLAAASKIAIATGVALPDGLDADSTIQFLTVVIPMAVAIYGRVTASHVITGTAAKAEILNNAAVASGVPVSVDVSLPASTLAANGDASLARSQVPL
jgi:hypothetical protein